MIAVISGATGLVGSLLVNKLLIDNDITQVISVSRNSLHIENPKLKEIIITTLSDLSLHQSELQGDIYFCCLGTTIKDAGSQENFKKVDYDAVIEFARIAKIHNAQSFVVISAAGANMSSLFFYSRVKGEVENALQKMHLKRLVIFRPSVLVGNRKTFRLGERIFIEILKTISLFTSRSLKKRMLTDAQDLTTQMLIEGKKSQAGIFFIR